MQPGSRNQQFSLKPVHLGKRSQPQDQRAPKDLLRNQALLEQPLTSNVKQYFVHSEWRHGKEVLAEVAQWCVDHEEPELFQLLCEQGCHGPYRLTRLDGSHILKAMLTLKDGPLNPMLIRIELSDTVTAGNVRLLMELLQSHHLTVGSLRCKLSPALPQAECAGLFNVLDSLYELQSLVVTVDHSGSGPLPEAIAQALLKTKRVLGLSRGTLVPLLVRDWKGVLTHDESARFLSCIDLPDVELPSWEAERRAGFPLFTQAVLCEEDRLLQALIHLDLAPCRVFSLKGWLPVPKMVVLLHELGFRIELAFELASPADLGRLLVWLQETPACLHSLTLALNGHFEAGDLQSLCSVLLGRASAPQQLEWVVKQGFQWLSSALVGDTGSARIECLRFDLGQGLAAHHEAWVQLIHWLKPRQLVLSEHGPINVLGLLGAWPGNLGLPVIHSLTIDCQQAAPKWGPLVEALEKFFGRFHKVERFYFNAGFDQWACIRIALLGAIFFNNDGLRSLTLTCLNDSHQRVVAYSKEDFSRENLARRVFTLDPPDPTQGYPADVVEQMGKGLEKAVQNERLLTRWGLHYLLTLSSGERNLPLAQALKQFNAKRIAAARNDQQQSSLLPLLERVELLLREEERLA
jgi:hypothetical protein